MQFPRARTPVVLFAVVTACSGSIDRGEDGPGRQAGGSGRDATGGAGSAGRDGTSASGGGTASGGAANGPAASGDPSASGMLGCPTVAAPGYGLQADGASAIKLSNTFKSICATCHGANGEGQGKYPVLPGLLTEASFIDKVRKGGNGMPAFTATELSDADLKSDFAALASRPASLRAGTAGEGEAKWDDARVQEAYTKGLAMWRQADAKGAACASCHSPDGVDLAAIAYTDDAILRRATLHLTAEQGLVVRDFIHAQRKRFGITRPCSTDWRPFQPGGEPLEGATREEQDLSFLKSLEGQKLLLLTDQIDTLAKAQAARDQLAALDLRKTKLGIHFAHWTEDGFNGPEHKSVNDWIPSLPRIPNAASRDAWYKLMDAYVANPTNATLYALLDGVDALTNDGGYAKTVEENAKYGGGWMSGVMQSKYESVLLAQHFFRMALQKKPGWLDLPAVPFTDHTKGYVNPWWGTGNGTIGAPCANDGACLDHYAEQFPPEVQAETGLGREALEKFTGDFSHNWFTIGELLDQGLLNTGGFGHNTTEAVYWNALKIGEHRALKDIFNSQRVVLQTMATTPVGPYGWSVLIDDNKTPPVPPLLHGQWNKVGLAGVPDAKDPRTPYLVRLEGNVMRMFLLLMKDMLARSGSVSAKEELLGDVEQHFGEQVDELMKRKQELVSAHPMLAPQMALYTDDLKALVADVTAKINAAKEVASAGPGGY